MKGVESRRIIEFGLDGLWMLGVFCDTNQIVRNYFSLIKGVVEVERVEEFMDIFILQGRLIFLKVVSTDRLSP